MARLRARVAELGAVNSDLTVYAESHGGAVADIHAAALAAMEADGVGDLARIVTRHWPAMLGLDVAALSFGPAAPGLRLVRGLRESCAVVLRGVDHGAPLFGADAPLVRSEALIDLAPSGQLGLGSFRHHPFDGGNGRELLAFLGGVVSRMLARWSPPTP